MPIILCELEGKTHRQAAEQLGWPVGTVSGRLSRARALLASRLSRPGTPLTVGALGVLLAHDAARAGVPPELVRSTAQAASLSTAGKAVAAGVVSAQVAALTGEVLKTMLINKLTLATAMLLVALALAAGGTSLTYRAHATESANPKKGSENPRGAIESGPGAGDLEIRAGRQVHSHTAGETGWRTDYRPDRRPRRPSGRRGHGAGQADQQAQGQEPRRLDRGGQAG